jgi:hypothetical protein
VSREALIAEIRRLLGQEKAAHVADLFLSPWIDERLLVEALAEEGGPGAAIWVVNRSDVYDRTLMALRSFGDRGVAERAEAKLAQRRSKLLSIDPPLMPPSLAEIPDHSVEDVLGHPLCPFEAMIFFARSIKEDHRASAALSLCRRLLEYPPEWHLENLAPSKLIEVFSGLLLADPSALVRSYAARVPLLPGSVVDEGFRQEPHYLVAARLLQNPATTTHTLLRATEARREAHATPYVEIVLALDERLPLEARRLLAAKRDLDPVARHFHGWYLEGPAA